MTETGLADISQSRLLTVTGQEDNSKSHPLAETGQMNSSESLEKTGQEDCT